MKSVNRVDLLGYLGKKPESRILPSGLTVCRFPLATREVKYDKENDSIKTETEWHRVVFVGPTAELATRYLEKGELIYLSGRIKTRQYTDQKEQTRYVTEILGQEFVMLNQKNVMKEDQETEETSA